MIPKVIGIDFDNTIICYDELFFELACDQKLIDSSIAPVKKNIRDAIRKLSDGENSWQKLQALVYGPMIHRAQLFSGFTDFLVLCHNCGIKTYIISHKTQYAAQDEQQCDLRLAAKKFLQMQGIFDQEHYGLTEQDAFFEPTRRQKIEQISAVSCDVFIDDLTETFSEEYFPDSVEKILFNPQKERVDGNFCLSVGGWSEVRTWLEAKA